MSEPEPHPVARRTLLGAAWAAPVVVAAAAAPSAAASPASPNLSVRLSGPSPLAGVTSWLIWVTNDSTAPIAAGTLTASLPDPAPGYFYSGFSGDVRWNYGDDPSGLTIVFVYNDVIAPGEEAGTLLLLVGKTDPAQTPDPVAILTLTAPGFDPVALPLTVTN